MNDREVNIVLDASVRHSRGGYVEHNADVNKITMRQDKGTARNSLSIFHASFNLKMFGNTPLFSNFWCPPMRIITFCKDAGLISQLRINLNIGAILNHYNLICYLSYLIENPTLDVNVARIVCHRFNKRVCPFQAAMNKLTDKPDGLICRLPNITVSARSVIYWIVPVAVSGELVVIYQSKLYNLVKFTYPFHAPRDNNSNRPKTPCKCSTTGYIAEGSPSGHLYRTL
jgi:hypothetical protein